MISFSCAGTLYATKILPNSDVSTAKILPDFLSDAHCLINFIIFLQNSTVINQLVKIPPRGHHQNLQPSEASLTFSPLSSHNNHTNLPNIQTPLVHGLHSTPLILHPPPPLKMRTLAPPSLHLTSASPPIILSLRPTSLLLPFKPKRFHFFKSCSSSLKQSKKEGLQKGSKVPRSLKRLVGENGEEGSKERKGSDEDGGFGGEAFKGTVLAGILLVGVVGGFGTVGYVYRDQINAFLTQFTGFIEGYGTAGYALFVAVYAGLEILAIPAIPLTMSAGLLFGPLTGTIIVSISGTVAATLAFLIARYFARERILKMVEGNKKFLAIDKAIGENGFRVVTLLRLSPLLPFSLGNYLYGLTSVKFLPYVLGSWLGMLPGTWAYVSAGAFGRAIIQEESDASLIGGNGQLLTFGLGLLATVLAAAYVTRLANDAVKDIE